MITHFVQSHILSRGPPNASHHRGQTLSIDHMLLECANVMTSTTQLTHWIPSLTRFLRLAQLNSYEKQDSSDWYEWSDILYNSSLESPPRSNGLCLLQLNKSNQTKNCSDELSQSPNQLNNIQSTFQLPVVSMTYVPLFTKIHLTGWFYLHVSLQKGMQMHYMIINYYCLHQYVLSIKFRLPLYLPHEHVMASSQIPKIPGYACAGNAGNVFPPIAGWRSRHSSRHVRHARAVVHAVIAD